MHIPAKFKQDDVEELISVIQQYPFATLVSNSVDGLDAMHLPFLLDRVGDELVLKGHIAKANPLWKKVNSGADVLVIFNCPNCYISPNHYPTKAQNGKAVPTWNYVVVHVQGKVSYSHDPEWIYKVIDNLTTIHEAGSDTPWSIEDAPAKFIEKMLPAVVGVEIEVTSIVGQWKLSQNQPSVNKQGVFDSLIAMDDSNSQGVAVMVRAHLE
ncbi:FMN-binding negative transcriptional regulator [Vibrio sp. ZSDZ34]|uniref:FMN-binding negative transcriptional regulator n=1 Tax=Vibrio gelatinilyticus TaxID=2893468 RepID=A0A9X2AY95_9VIBR|nr:FMN-binding negative transcriptional regulator [Vibrio gelatinilyticus]MCJ2376422.1 FMN-binding negative transcriptional regulator [Vibrio gelatinilyticus]